MCFKGELKNIVRAVIISIIAIIGSLAIVIGGLQNPMIIMYLEMCVVVIISALLYLGGENAAIGRKKISGARV